MFVFPNIRYKWFPRSQNYFFGQGKDDGLHIERNALHDNWDDADGYYSKLCYLMVIFLPVSLFFLRSNFAHVCPFIHSLVSATLQLTGLGN
jgi:hypothetical protein